MMRLFPTIKQFAAWSMPTKAGYVSAMAGILALPFGAVDFIGGLFHAPEPPPPQVVTTNITNNTIYSEAPPPPTARFDVTEPVQPLYFYSLDAPSLAGYASYRVEQSSRNLKEYDIEHVGTYYLDYPTIESAVVVFNDNADGTCHSCSGYFSVFEFIKEDGRWRLKSEILRFPTESSWGGAANDLRVIPISARTFGLFFHAGFLAQGTSMGWTEIRAIQDGDLVKVFEICDYVNESGRLVQPEVPYHFQAKVDVVPTPLGVYDLQVTVDADMYGETFKDSFVVRFNGAVYDTSGLAPYLNLPCA